MMWPGSWWNHMACEMCDGARSAGHRFCTNCGDRLTDRPTLRLALGIVMCIICAYFIAYELIAVAILFPETLEALSGFSTHIILIVPQIVNLLLVEGTALQIYFILLTTACFVSAFFLFRDVPGNVNKALTRQDYTSFQRSGLFEMSALFAALLTFQMSVITITLLLGADLESIDMSGYPTWAVMFSLVEASVWEEVLCRFLMLGVPVAVIAYSAGGENRSWKTAFGGFGVNRTVLVFILFSSFMFAAGHLENWGLWKFLPTFAFGLGLGYLFSRYGLHASIMLHFTNNLMSAGDWLSGSAVNSISLLLFPVLILGLYFMISYALRGTRFLRGMLAKDQSS